MAFRERTSGSGRDPAISDALNAWRCTESRSDLNGGVRLALETGQEDAETLLAVLEELGSDNIGVNFDPANMILYAMGDPVESFERLADHVMQVHIKDATKTETPGTWGAEVPVGTGEVDWEGFFGVMSAKGIDDVIEGLDERSTRLVMRDNGRRLLGLSA